MSRGRMFLRGSCSWICEVRRGWTGFGQWWVLLAAGVSVGRRLLMAESVLAVGWFGGLTWSVQ